MRRLSFGGNDRGAVMLIAVFFAVFAVSMLYLTIGVGEAVLFREHLQDAADSAALSAAIVHARLMNVLVLINIVMSVLLAILVTIKLIEGICYVGMAICAGLAWATFGGTLAAIPPLASLATNMSTLYQQVEPHVFNALETLKDVGDQIAQVAPESANAVAQADFADHSDVVSSGFAAPTTDQLPVVDDKYELLCGKAGAMAITIARIPLNDIPGLGEAMGALENPMKSMTSSLSQWFCGDGQNSVPNLDQDLDQSYPRTDNTEKCRGSDPGAVDPGTEKAATTKACQNAATESAAAQPDGSGNCQQQCELQGPYDQSVTTARQQCDPSGNPTPIQYVYQFQEGQVEYSWNGKQWVRGQEQLTNGSVNTKPEDANPCGDAIPLGLFFDPTACGPSTTRGFLVGYSTLVHPADDPSRTLPACTNECAPQTPPANTEKDPRRTVSFRQVTHILSCQRHEPVHVPVTDDKSPGKDNDNSNSKAPKRVTSSATLGSEEFQIRSLVVGNLAQRQAARLVRLSLWGAPDPSSPLERLKQYDGFAFAQAEYYYDKAGASRDDWMWSMDWRARLKRFEVQENKNGDVASHLKSKCVEHVEPELCSRWLSLTSEWSELLSH